MGTGIRQGQSASMQVSLDTSTGLHYTLCSGLGRHTTLPRAAVLRVRARGAVVVVGAGY